MDVFRFPLCASIPVTLERSAPSRFFFLSLHQMLLPSFSTKASEAANIDVKSRISGEQSCRPRNQTILYPSVNLLFIGSIPLPRLLPENWNESVTQC